MSKINGKKHPGLNTTITLLLLLLLSLQSLDFIIRSKIYCRWPLSWLSHTVNSSRKISAGIPGASFVKLKLSNGRGYLGSYGIVSKLGIRKWVCFISHSKSWRVGMKRHVFYLPCNCLLKFLTGFLRYW